MDEESVEESESFRFDECVRFKSFLSGVRVMLACEELVAFLRLNKSAVDERVGHCELVDVDEDDDEFSIGQHFRFVNEDFKLGLVSIFLRLVMALLMRMCSS